MSVRTVSSPLDSFLASYAMDRLQTKNLMRWPLMLKDQKKSDALRLIRESKCVFWLTSYPWELWCFYVALPPPSGLGPVFNLSLQQNMKHPISQRSFTASLLAKTYMSCYDRPSSLETNPTDHQEYPPSFVLILEPDSLAPQTFVFVVETSHSHKGKARKLFIILALPEMIKTTTAN